MSFVLNDANIEAVMQIFSFIVVNLVFETFALFIATDTGIEINIYMSVWTFGDERRDRRRKIVSQSNSVFVSMDHAGSSPL